MDVTQLPSWRVTECSQVADQDVRSLIDRVITYASVTTGVLASPAATGGDANDVVPALDNRVMPDGVLHELERMKEQAEGGDAASARRAAELYELLEDMDTAANWWHVAARLGDPDAQDYVRDILSQ